jgi:hypothetical protein
LFVVSNPEVVVDALTPVALAPPAFHVKVLPFNIVATKTSPKEFNDQRPGSSVTVDALTALPKPVQSVALVTVVPVAVEDGAVVPFVLLVHPVKSFPALPE